MRRLRGAFVTGLLVLMPLLATVDILRWFFNFIDRGVRNYLPRLPFDFWGLGILVSVLVVLVTGLLTQNYVGSWIINWADRTVRKFPIAGTIYSSIKKFLDTLFNPTNQQFSQAVLVEFPEKGFFSVGFLTGSPDEKIQVHMGEPSVNLFIPLVPNPISGFYVVVPKKNIRPLDMSVQEAFRVVISMGIVSSGGEKSLPGGPKPHG